MMSTSQDVQNDEQLDRDCPNELIYEEQEYHHSLGVDDNFTFIPIHTKLVAKALVHDDLLVIFI
jgi:hypothetical protein